MAVGIVDRQKLVNIADAVREKKGITGNMTLDAIASNITSMPTADNNAKYDFTGSGSKSSGKLINYLTTVDLSNFDTSNYTDMSSMFNGYKNLKSIDVSGLDTRNVTDMAGMFYDCSSLLNIDLSKNNLNKVRVFNDMFSGCKSLESFKMGAIENDVTSVSNMFQNCSNIKSIDLSNFRNKTTSQIYFHYMFDGCSSVESIDISGIDFSNAKSGTDYYGLSQLFRGCSKLSTLILPPTVSFNNSGISLNNMFSSCSSLTSLDLSNFDTTNVKYMYSMFNTCSSLTTLDLSSFNTTNVTDMGYMFNGCSKLSNLTLGTDWASNSSISSFSLFSCPLTHESAVDVINKLATRSNSPVITFSNQVGLYQSEIDVATNKGWSVSGCSVLVEDPSTATVGQYAIIDGEMSKCVYVADTPQSWGQRVFTTHSYFNNSNGVYRFQWGGYGTETGIRNYEIGNGLSNTNALIAMNLQSTDGTPTVWDAITEFRSTHSDRWFVPCEKEVGLLKEGTWDDNNGENKWSSSEYDNNSSNQVFVSVAVYSASYTRGVNKNQRCYLKPFTYV